VLATIAVSAIAMLALRPPQSDQLALALVFGAATLVAVVGAVDDVRSIDVIPRLVLQAIAMMAVLAALPEDLRVVPALPWWLERTFFLVGGLWLVNLTNFMDGIDWMTVAEVVPITAAIGVLGTAGVLPPLAMVVALALAGAVLGFAPFNRPVAKLFLGDVGSLPIGLLLSWLLIVLAGQGHAVAALLLPLYYLADATITLVRRAASGERIWEAHRSHFYQRATAAGLSVTQVVARVFTVNVLLALLACWSVWSPTPMTKAITLAAGIGLVGALLCALARGKP
jgi:UDP-N-acetylmuramyl pentapeptide phosphotransferase/UDP-N-acetylglucosamine-1-phosphate transferase